MEQVRQLAAPGFPTHIRVGLAVAGLMLWGVAASATTDSPLRVVASIKPVHSLVSAVMAGAGEPHLIMRGAASHHSHTLRPSDAAFLEEAGVVFLVDESMESALSAQVDTLARHARVVELTDAKDLVRRPIRMGGAFEVDHHHGHDEHDGEDEDEDRDDNGHDDHDHDHSHAHGHDRDDHDAGESGAFDLHVWLDPVNAAAMARMIADVLSEADSPNAERYAHNAQELTHRLDRLIEETAAELAPVREARFIVFHDGYRYFEDRFGLSAAGSTVVSPDRSPGVRRVRELREKVRDLGVVCVFDEPQFDSRLIATIVEGTSVRAGTVDPMGATLDDGPDLYFALIRKMAATFRDCLAPASEE